MIPPTIRDVTDEDARAAFPLKWGAVEPGVVPAWLAEMDFRLAPVVEDAIVEAVRRGTAGYPPRGDGGVGPAFAGFAERHWDWRPPADASVVVGDVIAGIRLVFEVLCPPGPVVVPLPCYPPFREVVAVAGRELVPVATDPDDDEATLDLRALETAFAGGARTLLLCSPHNPLGRVWTRSELEALHDLASAYGVRVVADEIHGPLTLPGASFAVSDRRPPAVVVTSASKAFNTPGLHCATVLTLDADEGERLRGVPLPMNNLYSPLGMVAAVAAYEHGDPWLAALVERLAEQRTLLGELVAEHLPRARMRPLEATYLPWLDLRAYDVADPTAVALDHGVRPAPGGDFQPGLEGHVRLNVATSPARLTTMIERLGAAMSTPAS